MKQPFTTLWQYEMKNDYSDTQDNEAGTQTEAENYLFYVSPERKNNIYKEWHIERDECL